MQNVVTDISKLDFARVAVIGCPGSGKTTFSKALAALLGREVVHLDKLLWNKNWQMLEYDKRVNIHNKIVSNDSWIIDGMWKSHLPDRVSRATLVIFLDYRRRVSLGRAVKRRIKYAGKQRDDIADGCLEKLDGYFLRYIWNFRKKVRPLVLQLLAEYPTVQVVALKTPRETKQFETQLAEFFSTTD